MSDELGSRDFQSVCRLFPLPGVVLFPHAVLPLHIFEPRYRQMTEDALETDKLITVVQLSPTEDDDAGDLPPIESVACMGKILNHESLPDGRFNFLLLGLKRVRLMRELTSDKLYRIAEAEILEDELPNDSAEPRRSELVQLFKTVTLRAEALDPDLASLLSTGLSLGALTDVIAHSLGLPPVLKQAFLADCCVERRADSLIEILHQVADHLPSAAHMPWRFPPSFSAN